MAFDEDQQQRVQYWMIPNNFHSGISFLGMNFEASYLIQGILLACIPFLLVYVLLPMFGLNIPFKSTYGFVTVIAFGLLYLGIHGVNGGTVLQFLQSISRYKKAKRVCYYNPRVKIEKQPLFEIAGGEHEKQELLSRENILKMYEKINKAMQKREQEQAHQNETDIKSNKDNLFFVDDVGILSTPVEYMDKKEYKAYLKQKRREERELRKAGKDKNDKKENK